MRIKRKEAKMKASRTLIAHIKRAEGCSLTAYQDSAGVWTIGYGHTRGVTKGDRISSSQAEEYLRKDLEEFEVLTDKVRRITTQGQYDAVLDFIYNCGTKNFNDSTLKRYIESGMPTWQIQEQFLRWVYAGGKKLGGLVSRRIWEAARFAE